VVRKRYVDVNQQPTNTEQYREDRYVPSASKEHREANQRTQQSNT
jgi:hypothetical protein